LSSNVFKNKVASNIGTSSVAVYTAPTGKTATIIGLSLANKISSDITCDITLTDTSTSTTVYLVRSAPIPTGSSLVAIGKDQKVVVENGDIISVVSSDTSSIDVVMSVMELDNGV